MPQPLRVILKFPQNANGGVAICNDTLYDIVLTFGTEAIMTKMFFGYMLHRRKELEAHSICMQTDNTVYDIDTTCTPLVR